MCVRNRQVPGAGRCVPTLFYPCLIVVCECLSSSCGPAFDGSSLVEIMPPQESRHAFRTAAAVVQDAAHGVTAVSSHWQSLPCKAAPHVLRATLRATKRNMEVIGSVCHLALCGLDAMAACFARVVLNQHEGKRHALHAVACSVRRYGLSVGCFCS